jgi:TPR repeat protein
MAMMHLIAKGAVAISLGAVLAGCSVGVKRTPGMKLYSSGDVVGAIPLLEKEVVAGEVSARYSLGLAYRDGKGVDRDLRKAEILLTGAAIGGDPRAVTAVRQLLEQAGRCPKDKALHDSWGAVGTMYRNLVTGVVELNTAPPAQLRLMAAIYDTPCEGAPVQSEAARSLRALSGGPRHMWIYVPG